ncbi:MAG TPA: serine/threonine-protein kinase [Drouetiella sp.]
MIESKSRDSGGFNKNAESTTARADADDIPTAVQNPLINQVFADKYLILEVLGEGGMSIVYLARHEALGKLFAIKTLHAHLMSKHASVMRFQQEAQAASRLQHPGIVAMHDYGVTEDGTPFLVMDYVQGESLGEMLQKMNSLTVRHALDIFKQTAEAISHAHERGIVHRDIKPNNIMLHFDDRGEMLVKIVDFGVAKSVDEEQRAKLTQTGESLGSPLYMSPEQCLGQPLDVRSDIYSFGCVMYETLTGVAAHGSEGVLQTMMKHINEVAPKFKEVRPDLSGLDALEKIVFKAMAKDPAKRYQSMHEMLEDLESVHEERSVLQNIQQKFELSGLRSTRKSLTGIAFTSLIIGALVLFGANFVFSTANAVTVAPNLSTEPPIWNPYRDKDKIKLQEGSDEQRTALSALQKLVVEATEDAVKQSNSVNTLTKQFDLACERRTRGTAARNIHQYDAATPDFSSAISFLESFMVEKAKGVQRAEAIHNLTLAYLGRGDCEYFNTPPDYRAASRDYGKAIEWLSMMKRTNMWEDFLAFDTLQLFLRNVDSYFMQGKYDEAAVARRLVVEKLSRTEQVMKDPSYRALNMSKIAEISFRTGKLQDAKEQYTKALTQWVSDGDNYTREQAIAAGRLAEINDLTKSERTGDLYNRFADLAEIAAATNLASVHNRFFADTYQSYANYLWRHGSVAKAIEMHQRSVKLTPAQ